MTVQRILLRFSSKKKNILRSIKLVNESFGWVSQKAMGIIARYFKVSESHIFSVASFYDEINLEKPSLLMIEVCDSSNCLVKSSDRMIQKIEDHLKIKVGEASRKFNFKKMSCLGRCADGPIVRINGEIYTKMNIGKVVKIIQEKTE